MLYTVDGINLTLNGALSKLNDGDCLLIKAGFHCAIELKDAVGITVTGEPGAVIDGGDGTACTLINCTDCKIKGLAVRGAGRKYESKQGVGFKVSGGKSIVIEDCEAYGFQRAGVELNGVEKGVIERTLAHDNGFCGIYVTWGEKKAVSRDITVRDCKAINNAGDPTVTHNHSGNGILLDGVQNAVVEFCEAAYNGWDMQNEEFNGPVGIWTAHTDNAVIRYCISHDNRTQWGKTDGGGFDFDGGTVNCVFEHCLSFKNDGAGYLLCQYENAPAMYDNEVRYCVSLDDGIGNHKCNVTLFDGGSPERTEGGRVYGCVFYNSHDRDIVQGHLDETEIEHCVMLKRGKGQFFRHEYYESALQYRGEQRQSWGEVRLDKNLCCDIDRPDTGVSERFASVVNYVPLTDPRALPEYFERLGLETL